MKEKLHLPKIIGLYSPYPRMGKSTIAYFLSKEFGYKLLKFSTPIKAPLYDLGLNQDEIEGKLKDTPCKLLSGKSPREKMHDISQELFKSKGSDCLSNIMHETLQGLKANGDLVVIDDVRFPENYKLIKEYPLSEVWRVHSSKADKIDAYDTNKLENMKFDLKLENSGKPKELFRSITNHLKNISPNGINNY